MLFANVFRVSFLLYRTESAVFTVLKAYIRNKLLLPGGFSMLVAEFLVQFYPSLCWGVGYCGLIDGCRGLYGWYCETDRACFGAFYPLCAADVWLAVHAFRLQLRGAGAVCYLMMMALLWVYGCR